MKYKVGDVVWLRKKGKAAVVKSVGDKYYGVKTYDGEMLTVSESELGNK